MSGSTMTVWSSLKDYDWFNLKLKLKKSTAPPYPPTVCDDVSPPPCLPSLPALQPPPGRPAAAQPPGWDLNVPRGLGSGPWCSAASPGPHSRLTSLATVLVVLFVSAPTPRPLSLSTPSCSPPGPRSQHIMQCLAGLPPMRARHVPWEQGRWSVLNRTQYYAFLSGCSGHWINTQMLQQPSSQKSLTLDLGLTQKVHLHQNSKGTMV